jgi:hypothetical protein
MTLGGAVMRICVLQTGMSRKMVSEHLFQEKVHSNLISHKCTTVELWKPWSSRVLGPCITAY